VEVDHDPGIQADNTDEISTAREISRAMRSDGRFMLSERRHIMAVLLPRQTRATVVRFAVMLTLSVAIAVMGLTANSAAVVIGAMLIAPLMTPIMTFSAAIGLGLPRRAVQAALAVVFGAVGAIGLAYALAFALPDVSLGSEILARTSPDVRDLVVAVAAGAAGAYAIARTDVSAALPGVAIAVALVPPLATTGIVLQAGRSELAEGSLLLFITNLLAIVVSGLVVFLVTGVVPTISLCLRNARLAMTAVGVVIATVAVAVPLTARSVGAARTADVRRAVAADVSRWIGDRDLEPTAIDVTGRAVTVELRGSDEPPSAYDLAEHLVDEVGPDVEVTVRWSQSAKGEAQAGRPPVVEVGEVELVRPFVETWLATAEAATGAQYTLVDLEVSDGNVVVVVSGSAAPPPSARLAGEIADSLGRDVTVTVRWLQELDISGSGETVQQRAERLATAWLGARRSVRLLGVSADRSLVSVDLASDGDPLGVGVLRDVMRDAFGDVRVDIRTVPMQSIDAVVVPPVPAIE
jgi:uncharacterized hydrophobic protein (TIGR00271 family)